MLRVRVLGEMALEGDEGPLELPQSRPARELLGWLALNPGLHGRGELAARFWPDVLDTSARASLRTALYDLRRALGGAGDGYLVADRERVGLADAGAVWVDALEVERLAREGSADEALALCTGDPLPGLDPDWVFAARDEYRHRVAGLLTGVIDEARAAGDLPRAIERARELVRLDPLSEDGNRRLIELLAEAGDRPAALAAYARLEERLRRELAVPPSARTRELAASIKSAAPPRPAAPAQLPLPPTLRRRDRSSLVGRRPELERLLDAVSGGEQRLVLVTGEPGIGKTRIVSELGRAAHTRGAVVLYGRCYEEQLTPYQPFVEALSFYATTADADELHIEAGDADLARLVPAIGARLGVAPAADADAEGARWRLFEAVAALLDGAGRRGPVLVVLDDLHWADSSTLLLLSHLVRRDGAAVLAGAYRESEISRAHPLAGALADLRRDSLIERVALRGLDADDVSELVSSWLGPEAPGELARAVHAETGGNPFFVEEVLRHLGDRQVAGSRELVATIGIPESVKDVIGRRLSRLSEQTDRVLSVAAVAGREFDLALLERLEPLAGIDVLAALEEAEAAQMVREEPARPGRYAFAHALIRETLYDELSLTRRVRLHRALADALDRSDEHLAELAHHRLEAAAGFDVEPAVAAALAAAEQAMRTLAYAEAAALCERALTALEATPEERRRRAEVLLALGAARQRAGETLAAREAFAQAAAIGRSLRDSALLAGAALGFSGLGVTIIAVDNRSVALLHESLGTPPEDLALRARVTARLAMETYYACTPAERKALGDEAVRLARASGDAAALVDALGAQHVAMWSAQYLDERLATADEMIAVAASAGDAERELQGRNWRVCDLGERGDIDAMLEEVEAHERLAEQLRLPNYQWWAPMWRSTVAILQGRFEEARALIETFTAIGRRAEDPNAQLYGEIAGYQLDQAFEHFDTIEETMLEREIGRPAEYAYRAGYSWILAAQGHRDRAREQIEWVTGDGWSRARDDMNLLASFAELTQALLVLGERGPAAEIYERLLPYAERVILNGRGGAGYGFAAHHLGVLAQLLERRDAAAAHFEDALRLNGSVGARTWIAQTQERYGMLLVETGSRERGRELLESALATGRELGIAPLAARVQAFL